MSPLQRPPKRGTSPGGVVALESFETLLTALGALDPSDGQYATRFVDALLSTARARRVSDLHLRPTPEGLDIRWRLDGVLQPLGLFPPGIAANVVVRLKVLAELLTYRTDMPQEGRMRAADEGVEMRVSTFPTLYGEKAVVRIFSAPEAYLRLVDLGLPAEVVATLDRLLNETSGAILVSGPAGSGKTTTLYACLREIVAHSGGGRNLTSLEDPIEAAVDGVSQSQVNPPAGFTLASGLRSIMRQDPEVILVGEIRDRETAELALQASLTGQLVLTSFHAPSAAGAVSRLTEMGLEPYVLRSGLLAVASLRLLRTLCSCAAAADDEAARLALPVSSARVAVGCTACAQSGYRGRMPIAEVMLLDRHELAQAVLARSDTETIQRLAVEQGMISLWQRALALVESGRTSPAEVRRVLGFRHSPRNGAAEVE